MTETTKPSQPHFLRDVLQCPECGNTELEAVSDGDDTNFLCHECGSCWHWDLGYMMRVPVGRARR